MPINSLEHKGIVLHPCLSISFYPPGWAGCLLSHLKYGPSTSALCSLFFLLKIMFKCKYFSFILIHPTFLSPNFSFQGAAAALPAAWWTVFTWMSCQHLGVFFPRSAYFALPSSASSLPPWPMIGLYNYLILDLSSFLLSPVGSLFLFFFYLALKKFP